MASPAKPEQTVLVPTWQGDVKKESPSIILTLNNERRIYQSLGSRYPNSSRMTKKVIVHVLAVLEHAFTLLGEKVGYMVDVPKNMTEGSKTKILWKWDLKTHPDAPTHRDEDGEEHPGVRDEDVTLGDEKLYKDVAQQLKGLPHQGHFLVSPVVKGVYSNSDTIITLNVECTLTQLVNPSQKTT